MTEFLLGIDLGTSGVKVGAVDFDGRLLALAFRAYETFHPKVTWSEQDPAEWWAQTAAAVREVMRNMAGKGQLVGIGLSGQTPGHVLVAKDGTPLGKAIIWSDCRAEEEAAEISRLVSSADMQRFVGFGFPVGATNPLARLLWIVRNRKEEVKQAVAVLQPKDFIALRLTGQIATDLYSSFSVANILEKRYNSELFERLGIPLKLLPPLFRPEEEVGKVTKDSAKLIDVPAGTPVTIGTIDTWCGILGSGALSPGIAVDIAGTSEQVAVVTARPKQLSPGVVWPLWPGLYFSGGPTQMGASVLSWLQRILSLLKAVSFPDLESVAKEAPPGTSGLVFLPYLRGERMPIWDSSARGVFFGLTDRHTRAHIVRAVYEGIAYSIRHVLEIACENVEQPPTCLHVSGGGAHSTFWNQIKADVAGVPVVELENHESAIVGAAMLAACPPSAPHNLAKLSQQMVRLSRRYTPNSDLAHIYDRQFEVYKALYLNTKKLMHKLGSCQSRKEVCKE